VAESTDGLCWKMVGVALSRNEEEWWAFDTAHVGLGDVFPLSAATDDDAAYRRFACSSTSLPKGMYFFGGAEGETELRSLGIEKDGTVAAMDLRVGLAVSQGDVDKFARMEGDFPTGEILSIAEDDNQWDATYVGWPSIVDDPKTGARYMTYQALDKRTKRQAVGLAKSASKNNNAILFKKLSMEKPAFGETSEEKATPAYAKAGVTRRCLRPQKKQGYQMWFEGQSMDGEHSIGRATTSAKELAANVDWTVDDDPCFQSSPDPDAWDAGSVSAPFVCRLDEHTLRMYYSGASADDKKKMAIGVAESKDHGRTWTRVDIDAQATTEELSSSP